MDIRITSAPSLTPKLKTNTKINSALYVNKNSRATNKNSLLALPKVNTLNSIKPKLSIKITSNLIQPQTQADRKGVLLYQQVERNKIFSNNSELINRFQFKV